VQLTSLNSFNSRQTLDVNGKEYVYYSLIEAEKNGLPGISRLPISLKVVLENLLRFEDGTSVTRQARTSRHLLNGWIKKVQIRKLPIVRRGS